MRFLIKATIGIVGSIGVFLVVRTFVPAPGPLDPANASPAPAQGSRVPPAVARLLDSRADDGDWAQTRRHLRDWTARDPEAALAWARALPIKEDRVEAGKEICLRAAEWDPGAAMDAAWDLELGRFQELGGGVALETIARQWACADFPAALAWARRLPGDEDENDGRLDLIMKGLAVGLSGTAPEPAARLVAEQMRPGSGQVQAAMAVLRVWSERDPAAAAAWAEQFPSGSLRKIASENVARSTNPNPPR